MISDEKAEKCLHYLAETDLEYAELRGKREALIRLSKRVLAQVALSHMVESKMAQGKAQEAARASEEYNRVVSDLDSTELEFFKIGNKRDTAHVILDTWRTIQANRRKG